MATYTFVPNVSQQSVDWGNTASWSGGVAPNSADADVVFPGVTYTNSGDYFVSTISIAQGLSYLVNSISLTQNEIEIAGTLTVNNAFDVNAGGEIDMGDGTLNAGSLTTAGFDLQGEGQVNVTGSMINQSMILGLGLIINAATFDNQGELIANQSLTLNVGAGGFANFSGGALSGGTYEAAEDSVLYLNIGGAITTDDADMILAGTGGAIDTYNSAQSAYASLQSTLSLIGASGVLELESASFSWNALSDQGLVVLDDATMVTPQLSVQEPGVVLGTGQLQGSLEDDGVVIAGLTPEYLAEPQTDSANITGTALDITGAVTGSATLEIAPAAPTYSDEADTGEQVRWTPWTLELGSSTAANVIFLGDHGGKLILDDPSGYGGVLTPEGGGDEIQLMGSMLSQVTSYSYSGGATGGTLTIDLGASQIALNFQGDFTTQSFSLSAGPQVLSSDPQSLLVTVNSADTPIPPVDMVRAQFADTQNGAFSDILIENTSGVVDYGQISANGQEAYTNITGLGQEWTLEGVGEFLTNEANDPNPVPSYGFLMENTSGDVYITESNGKFIQLPGLGPEWSFEGVGDFLSEGHDQYLIENTSGALVIGDYAGANTFTTIGGLGPEWKFEGVGAFTGDGVAQFLIENGAGVVDIGQVVNGQASYSQIAGLGPEWKFVATGDFLNDGRDQFLIENTAGAVVIGEVGAAGQAQYTTVGGLGPEWTIEGAGDFLGDGHDQFVMENTNGAVVIGNYQNGQIQYTQVSGLGSEWKFHN